MIKVEIEQMERVVVSREGNVLSFRNKNSDYSEFSLDLEAELNITLCNGSWPVDFKPAGQKLMSDRLNRWTRYFSNFYWFSPRVSREFLEHSFNYIDEAVKDLPDQPNA